VKLGEVAGAEREHHGKHSMGCACSPSSRCRRWHGFGISLMAFPWRRRTTEVEHPVTGRIRTPSRQTSLIDARWLARWRDLHSHQPVEEEHRPRPQAGKKGPRPLSGGSCRTSNIVAENFKPGSMHAWGLDYDSIAPLHPGLIYVSVSGFGNLEPSPYREWPAYAPIVEAMVGIFEALAKPGQRPPHNLGGPHRRPGGPSALTPSSDTLCAVIQRGPHGDGGQYVESRCLLDAGGMPSRHGSSFMCVDGGLRTRAYAAGLVDAFAASDGYFVPLSDTRAPVSRGWPKLIGAPEWLCPTRGCDAQRLGGPHQLVLASRDRGLGEGQDEGGGVGAPSATPASAAGRRTFVPKSSKRDEHLRYAGTMLLMTDRLSPRSPARRSVVVGNPVKDETGVASTARVRRAGRSSESTRSRRSVTSSISNRRDRRPPGAGRHRADHRSPETEPRQSWGGIPVGNSGRFHGRLRVLTDNPHRSPPMPSPLLEGLPIGLVTRTRGRTLGDGGVRASHRPHLDDRALPCRA